MKQTAPAWEKDGYLLRPAQADDAENYYMNNFVPLDPETAMLTGCKPVFSREEVISAFLTGKPEALISVLGCSIKGTGGRALALGPWKKPGILLLRSWASTAWS